MLGWAIGFFVAALVAAVFGFGGIASAFSGIAVILFWLFLGLFVLSLLFNTFTAARMQRRTAARAVRSRRSRSSLALRWWCMRGSITTCRLSASALRSTAPLCNWPMALRMLSAPPDIARNALSITPQKKFAPTLRPSTTTRRTPKTRKYLTKSPRTHLPGPSLARAVFFFAYAGARAFRTKSTAGRLRLAVSSRGVGVRSDAQRR
jgi:uncharacterized membrane protein YtjA (UPF0391 family)